MQTLHVPGLEAPADIVVDKWGIPHIRAATRRDIFFVQGFNAARDRGWQLDLWYKRGLGRMAADFGPGFLAQDRAARLFLYRGDMAAEWAAYGTPETRSIVEAFVDGVNAWNADPARHAPEHATMGTAPATWLATEMMSIRSHALVRNALSEARRAQIMHHADAETDLARRSLEPAWTPIIPEGLNLADITEDVLDVFRLATVSPKFPPARMACTLADAWKWSKVTELGDVYMQGSNNWVVAPSRTDTGRPILASDPHRAHALPSLRYIVHLTGPGLDAIGTGEPAVPGISFGHNGTAAFGLTIFPMDQEDLYVYETHPDDPTKYRYLDGWEAMTEITETIAVRGEADQTVTLRFTRHGPVVAERPATQRAFAIRSVWAEPGTFAYFASLACMQATTPAEYEAAVSHWRAPSINHVYADTAGNIAWWARGLVPLRTTWDGLLPAPGDGRHEWQGFLPMAHLPSSLNPAEGYFATANEMNLPADYPIDERRIGFEWAEHGRSGRIAEVLAGQNRHGLAQSMALQTDATSIPARRLTALVHGLADGRHFEGWDHRLDRTSAPAALHELWWAKHLRPAMLDILAPDKAIRPLMVPGDTETLLGLLESHDPRLGNRDALLAKTLAAAVADANARMGDAWAWGKLHHGYFEHPLAGQPDVGPLPKGGSGAAVMNAGYRPSDFRVTSGASFRMVVDVGAWDNSVCINAPGQSGDPASPHYADLAPLWAAGEYVPMLYSREAVDAAAAHVIKLLPC